MIAARLPLHNARVLSRALMLPVIGVLLATGTRAYVKRDMTVVEKVHANGVRAERREYRRGLEDGVHRGWHENGTPRFLFHYVNGVAEGMQEEWYPDGTRYTRFEYVAGHEEGRQQMWTDAGVLRANYVVEHGRRYGLMGTSGCEGIAHEGGVAERAAGRVPDDVQRVAGMTR